MYISYFDTKKWAIVVVLLAALSCKKNDTAAPLKPVQTIQPAGTAQLVEVKLCAASAAVGDKIYTFGGSNVAGPYLNTIEVFDTETKISTQLNVKLQEPKAFLTATAVGDSIYIFGGRASSGASSKIEVFDTKKQIISTLSATLSESKDALCSALIGDSIYVLGGRVDNSPYTYSKKIEVLNVKTQKISTLTPSLTKNNYFMSATAIGNNIYIFGGIERNSSFDEYKKIEIFNTKTQISSILDDSLSRCKWGTSAVAIEDKIFVFGGSSSIVTDGIFRGEDRLNTIEMLDTKTKKVSVLPIVLAQPNYGTCAAGVGNKVYVFGGYYNNNYLKTIEIFQGVR